MSDTQFQQQEYQASPQEEMLVRPINLDEGEVVAPEVSGEAPKRRFLSKPWQKVLAIVGVVLLFLLSVGAVLGFYTYAVVTQMKGQITDVETTAPGSYDQFK